MGDTSLTVDGYTFVFNPGDIELLKEVINARAEQIELAGLGPMSNSVYDYNGTFKIITITGQLTEAASTRVSGYTITTILAQKQWLESVINGNQSLITLVDDYAGQSVLYKSGATPPYLGSFTSTKAMKGSATFQRRRGNPNKVDFEINLLVGQ